jgi:hypothetical protein
MAGTDCHFGPDLLSREKMPGRKPVFFRKMPTPGTGEGCISGTEKDFAEP